MTDEEANARSSPFEGRFPINVGITGYVATTGEVGHRNKGFTHKIMANGYAQCTTVFCLEIQSGKEEF